MAPTTTKMHETAAELTAAGGAGLRRALVSSRQLLVEAIEVKRLAQSRTHHDPGRRQRAWHARRQAGATPVAAFSALVAQPLQRPHTRQRPQAAPKGER